MTLHGKFLKGWKCDGSEGVGPVGCGCDCNRCGNSGNVMEVRESVQSDVDAVVTVVVQIYGPILYSKPSILNLA